jgi:hypothetical protein
MTFASYIGGAQGQNAGVAGAFTVSVNASTAVGDVVVVGIISNAATTPTAPGGWVTLLASTASGTMSEVFFAHTRQTGETTYSFSIGNATTASWMATTWRGALDPSVWTVGSGGQRAVNGTSSTCVAPGLATVGNEMLAVTFSMERTSTTETAVTSISSGTQLDFFPQASALTTLNVSALQVPSPTTTAAVTVTYPNTQASNGFAIQIGIPATVQSVGGTGIVSAEALGTPTITQTGGGTLVSPTGIASTEAFGAATINSILTVTPTGVPSAEAFGNQNVSAVVAPGGIPTGEAFGAPSIGVGVSPGGMPSAESFGAATITGKLTVTPTGIVTAETFGNPVISQAGGPQTVVGAGVPSAEAFGAATIAISGGPKTILAAGIATAEAFGAATVSNPGTSSGMPAFDQTGAALEVHYFTGARDFLVDAFLQIP